MALNLIHETENKNFPGDKISNLAVSLLKNVSFMFILAILLGLALGGIPFFTEYIATAALIIVMTFTTMNIELKKAFKIKKYLKNYLVILVLNYLFLTGIILFFSYLLIPDKDLRAGFVIMAAIPPAVAVIPFTAILKGDLELSVGSSAFLYVLSLILAPIIVVMFMGENIDILKLIQELFLMIVLPLIVSRALLYYNVDNKLQDGKDILINLGFFVLIFTVVGVNRSAFLLEPSIMIAVSFICLFRTFVAGVIVYHIGGLFHVDPKNRINYLLFGSFKNLGLTIIIAFTLFGEKAAIPAAICMPFEILTLPYYKRLLLNR
jgi:BASS family bile acid:Na+ symporter